jgi:hypothetical protein
VEEDQAMSIWKRLQTPGRDQMDAAVRDAQRQTFRDLSEATACTLENALAPDKPDERCDLCHDYKPTNFARIVKGPAIIFADLCAECRGD